MWFDMSGGRPVDDQIAERNFDRRQRAPDSPPAQTENFDDIDPVAADAAAARALPNPATGNSILDMLDELSDEAE